MLHLIPPEKILSLEQAAAESWDVVIVGAGMGGGTLAYALAKQGHKVLALDKGAANFDGNEESVSIEPETEHQQYINGKWPTRIRTKIDGEDHDMWAPLGCGMGGSSLLYAAALQRLKASDFEQRPSPAGDMIGWPFSYQDIAPYYKHAEQLFSVRGTTDPLDENIDEALAPPPAMCEQDQHFFQLFKQAGYNPYRLHVGAKYIKDCGECGGKICNRDCKQDAYSACIVPGLATNNLFVCEYAEASHLDADATQVNAVHVRHTHGDATPVQLQARIIVLAAGAYFTPLILKRSHNPHWPQGVANQSGLVGRNLMFHASDYIGIWPKMKCSRAGPNKTIALRDLYEIDGEKLGEFQSTGLAADFGLIMYSLRLLFDQSMLSKLKPLRHFLRIPAWIAAKLYGDATVFTTIVEDFPYRDNQVIDDPKAPSGMRFEYTIHDELKTRVIKMRELMRKRLHGIRALPLNLTINLNYGHPCGTARAGVDPQTSVVNSDCKAHTISNLYIADASIMPTSGGTNPSLTIAANALRMADKISAQLDNNTVG